ncbi:MAG: hypothetical protein IPF48_03620 [Sphingomonadales bacterium]|nr:hypothetical protein [Sphingomonadales bacterium]
MATLRREVEGQAVVACRNIRIVGPQDGKTNLQGMVVERLSLQVAAPRRQVAGDVVLDPGKLGIVVVHRCPTDLQSPVIKRLRILIAALPGKS